MKGTTWERIVRREFSSMEPNLAIKGRLIYLRPVEHILAGVDLNPSYNDVNRSDLEAFAMPLVVPREDVAYTLGERLSEVTLGSDVQELPPSVIADIERGLNLAASWKSPRNFLRERSWKRNKNELYVAEVEAYLHLHEGEAKRALKVIRRALKRVPEQPTSFERESAERLNEVFILASSNEISAAERIRAWEERTLASLRIDR